NVVSTRPVTGSLVDSRGIGLRRSMVTPSESSPAPAARMVRHWMAARAVEMRAVPQAVEPSATAPARKASPAARMAATAQTNDRASRPEAGRGRRRRYLTIVPSAGCGPDLSRCLGEAGEAPQSRCGSAVEEAGEAP